MIVPSGKNISNEVLKFAHSLLLALKKREVRRVLKHLLITWTEDVVRKCAITIRITTSSFLFPILRSKMKILRKFS